MAANTRSFLVLALLASLSASFFLVHASAVHTLAGSAGAGAGAGVVEIDDATDAVDAKQVYVVFTERLPASETDGAANATTTESYHHGLLGDVLDAGSSEAQDRVLYHYSKGFHGFAARLTNAEKNRLADNEAVISIHEKVVYWPQTTRSWDFIGLPKNPLPFEKDVVIGMVDTGIWPESESFSDDDLPVLPSKWKGVCSNNFTCNHKIIGARSYRNGSTGSSPRDMQGHGTHTASIAAGRAVASASLGGLAGGTARGGVPGARLAVYKVCWEEGCSSEDILAAMDDAIADGVDVISASLGTPFPFDYANDPMAIAAFHAMRHGVVTSVSAGNDGPSLRSVCNVAAWTISTAATTIDRRIVSELVLGDGRRIAASTSINVFPGLGEPSLLVDPGSCLPEQLDGKRYKGAVLLCTNAIDEVALNATGAHGAIMYSMENDNSTAFSFAFPTMYITQEDYNHVVQYYNTTNRPPMATLKSSVTVKDASSPRVAVFSSRGPNQVTHGLLKPDISAPGVDILAAWSGAESVSGSDVDVRRTKYNIISGTSMACPHVTGAAAYVKSMHPSWSHAAVLSALVTTATPMKSGEPEAELAYGAGQVNPLGAGNPGLVYDAEEADYVAFLCAQGYNATQLATMTGTSKSACPAAPGAVGDLNYPSIAVPVLNYGVPFTAKFPRTVSNVGPADSVYRVTVTTVPGINVTVTPGELAFSASKKKLGFTVTVSGTLASVNGRYGASASVVWSDGTQKVRSPVYVFPSKHVV